MEEANTIVDTPDDEPSPLEALTAERDKLAAEKASLEDLMLRRQAELENFRRRVEREKAETREFASMDTVQALLPILDDFERSVRAAPAGDYAKGVELIYRRLLESLMKLGLEAIPAEGALFDPNLHNAIQKEERNDVADQTVLEEYSRGYRFKGRLLRPAMVKVAVKP